MNTRTILTVALCGWLALGGTAVAQDNAPDATALAKAAQNPLAALVTLPMQANYNTGWGPYDRTFFNLNIQPVVPFRGENWNLIVRTIIPVNSVPQGETVSSFVIGDATVSLFASPAKPGAFTWGLGPVIGLPTSSNPQLIGSERGGLGPTGIVFYQVGKWTMGGVASNIWSVVGDSDHSRYNIFTLQYFLNLNFGHGWALGTAPILSANWDLEPGNRWTIPWGAQISKLMRVGKQPVNLLFGYYYNAEHPDGAADRQVRLQTNFMFPTGAN